MSAGAAAFLAYLTVGAAAAITDLIRAHHESHQP